MSVQILQKSLKIQKRINQLLKKRMQNKVKSILKSKKPDNNSQKSLELHASSKHCCASKIEIEKAPLRDSNSEGISANETLSPRTEQNEILNKAMLSKLWTLWKIFGAAEVMAVSIKHEFIRLSHKLSMLNLGFQKLEIIKILYQSI